MKLVQFTQLPVVELLGTLLEATVIAKCISKTYIWRNKKCCVESQIWLIPLLVPSVDLFMGYKAGKEKDPGWLYYLSCYLS